VETTGLLVEPVGADEARAEVHLRNTSERATAHVVQVYVATGAGPVRRPARELRAFRKVWLAGGESTSVSFALDRRAFAYWDIRYGRWVVPAGDYQVQIGRDAENVLMERGITLTGDSLVLNLSIDSPIGEWVSHPEVGPRLDEALQAALAPLRAELAAGAPAQGRSKALESLPLGQLLNLLGAAMPPGGVDDVLRIVHGHLATAPQ
jgi:beta-glucosidase